MEVHHHSHHGKKKWTGYFWEFLMLFFAVSAGFYAENLREGIIHKEQVKTNMRSLLSDLQSDLLVFDSVIERNQYAYTMADSLIELLHGDISNTPEIYFTARAVTANIGYYYSNPKSFDQMKSAGILRFIHPHDLLDSLGNYYVSFQWLADQTELLRFKLDAVHKGNSVLFDSYTFFRMMKNIQVYSGSFNGRYNLINRPEGHPALLSTASKDVNEISLNYHYYSSTAKFYNRTAVVQRQRAIRLIELIKKAYHFE
jgi:hypothetical protein